MAAADAWMRTGTTSWNALVQPSSPAAALPSRALGRRCCAKRVRRYAGLPLLRAMPARSRARRRGTGFARSSAPSEAGAARYPVLACGGPHGLCAFAAEVGSCWNNDSTWLLRRELGARSALTESGRCAGVGAQLVGRVGCMRPCRWRHGPPPLYLGICWHWPEMWSQDQAVCSVKVVQSRSAL